MIRLFVQCSFVALLFAAFLATMIDRRENSGDGVRTIFVCLLAIGVIGVMSGALIYAFAGWFSPSCASCARVITL